MERKIVMATNVNIDEIAEINILLGWQVSDFIQLMITDFMLKFDIFKIISI